MATFNPKVVRLVVSAGRAQNCHVPAANNDAVVTYPGVSGRSHAITDGIAYSYSGSGSLTGGLLTVTCGTTTIFSMAITAKGPGFVPFRCAARVNEELEVTLAAGGADVSGMVNVLGYERLTGAPQGVQGAYDFSDYLQSGLVATI